MISRFRPPRRGARRRARRLAALVPLLLAAGCSWMYEEPSVRILGVRVVGLGLTAGTAEVELEVDNPNRFAFEVREFGYLLEVAEGDDRWTELTRGTAADTVRIPGRTVERVTLPVPFQYRGAGTAIRAWFETGEIRYRFRGELTARAPTRTLVLPLRSEGTIAP